MPRLSAMALDALYGDPLMSDPAELLADGLAVAGSGTACRVQIRGRELALELSGFSTAPKIDEYTVRVRVSEIAAPAEGQVFLNTATGLRYRITEPPTLQGPDRAEWLCYCQLVA